MVLLGYLIIFSVAILLSSNSTSAQTYRAEVTISISETVYRVYDNIEISGTITRTNTTNGALVENLTGVPEENATIEFLDTNNTVISWIDPVNLTTDTVGRFFSNSTLLTNATTIQAPNITDRYIIRATYIDPNETKWNTSVEILVVNQTVDKLKVRTNKATYNPTETIKITAQAIRIAGDTILFSDNVSINGTIRNETKSILNYFNCTTDTTGGCQITETASTVYGDYIVELDNFKAFTTFQVRPFQFNLYIKDELGKSLKNTFKINDQASVDVAVITNQTDEEYTFIGNIEDKAGNIVKTISSTTLSNNNTYNSRFIFTVDANTFDYGVYRATVTVTKTGDGSANATTSFEVRDWDLNFRKREIDSGFEYGHSAFPNMNVFFQVFPTYRSNGSVIGGINETFFNITLEDKLKNKVAEIVPFWNDTCSTEGCYDFSFTTPSILEEYTLFVKLANDGDTQTEQRVINVIDTVIGAQTITQDGDVKELFSPDDYVYVALAVYNNTDTDENVTEASIVSISHMNGTAIPYTTRDSFSDLNLTTGNKEWAWNDTLQQFKVAPPRAGGVYDVHIGAKNNTASTLTRFIINPYDVCMVGKTTAGNVATESSAYYAWQYKTTDNIYFELGIVQAVNPAGRATADNYTNSGSNSSYGAGTACTVDTQTKQVVSNATVTVKQVKNLQSGKVFTLNDTTTICQADNNNGQYTCTIEPIGDWDGGQYNVEFEIKGEDGETSDIAFGLFEARAFYLYGWSTTWQNKPSSNIVLTVQMYEAGSNWWGSYGSGGLSGTVSVEKVEYMGRYGEEIWPPLEFNYTNISSETASITTGQGTITLEASNAQDGTWKTGNYRVILKGVDSGGNTDYGYAGFSIRRWDVYGMPVGCDASGCSYKGYFNSKDNITLFIRIVTAGDWSSTGWTALEDNVSIKVKKIEDCRTWPCKDINRTDFTSEPIYLNESSNWYWNTNGEESGKFLLHINTTDRPWGTGNYRAILDVNGSETGTAWFNTIAFYAYAFPTNENNSDSKYQFKGAESVFFNLTTTKSYNWGYWSGGSYAQYTTDDYVNTSFVDVKLRRWDSTTRESMEYNYPEDINATPSDIDNTELLDINGTGMVNLTYLNGNWPSGYYYGELTLNNSDGEEANAWLWFEIRPFRVSVTTHTNYEIDSNACVNTTIDVYEPSWYISQLITGNFSIAEVYEDQWTGSYTRVSYNNFTNNDTFSGTLPGFELCPNSGNWGAGSWGGYHSLNVIVKDNTLGDSVGGWVSFRSVPFRVSWGTIANQQATNDINVTANLTKPSNAEATTGNLSRVYQWRWDNYKSTIENYEFMVGTCDTRVSGTNTCAVNGTENATIFAPSGGWKLGYNYLQAEWVEENDATSIVKDWSNIYFNALELYNGYFDNRDANNNWKYDFELNDPFVFKIYLRDADYNEVTANLTRVEYAKSENTCWDDFCRTYTTGTYAIIGNAADNLTISGNALVNITPPSAGWERARYRIRATVQDPIGTSTATIKGLEIRAKNATLSTINITTPLNNETINSTSIPFSATTSIESRCWVSLANFDSVWWCYNWDSENITARQAEACNTTAYGYNGTDTHSIYLGESYYSEWDGENSSWSSGSARLVTGGIKTHTYTLDTTNWPAQHYSIEIGCNDEDYNYVRDWVTFNYTNIAI